MSKDEFIEKIEKLKIKSWGIGLGYLSEAGFVLGCYFNQNDNKWHVYETDEKGIEESIFKVNNEEEAYEKLYELIIIHID